MKKGLFLLFSIFICLSCQQEDAREPMPFQISMSKNTTLEDKPPSAIRNHYLLVHGAWHPEAVWSRLKLGLEKSGHEVKTVQLPGLGTDCTPNSAITLQTHIDAVMNVLNTFTEPVILVGHSYGGLLISEVGERAPQKIKQLVYIAAFMLADGESLFDIASQDVNSVAGRNLVIQGADAVIPPAACIDAFYNYSQTNSNPDLDEYATMMVTLIKPHPVSTLVTPIHIGTNYASLPKLYIRCPNDRAISVNIQDQMLSRFPETQVETIQNSDHSPFVSRPQQLLNVLKNL